MDQLKAKTLENYSAIAPLYIQDFKDSEEHFDWVEDVLNLAKRQRLTKPIVDLGSGPGQVVQYLKNKKYPTLVAVDFTPEFIDLLRQKYPNNPSVRIVQSDMVDFVEHQSVNSIAAYVALFSIIHIPDGELDRLFRDLYRTLMPKGVTLMSVYLGETKSLVPQPFQVSGDVRLQTSKKLESYLNTFTKDEIESRLTKVGFKILKSDIYHPKPKPGEYDIPEIWLLAEK